jgi:nicotinamide mononucleotide transporter
MSNVTITTTAVDDPAAPERTPLWGTPQDRRAAVVALAGASVATAAYAAGAHLVGGDYRPTALEVVGTATSLACVWLIRRQNVLSMPLGLISVVAMGAFFFEIELVGQGWLHLGYYVPIQFAGWWFWIRGGERRSDLPVSWMTLAGRLAAVAVVVAGTLVLARLFESLHGPTDALLWDSSIVAASVAAQLLLTVKRIESWLLWLIPVDVSAIALYALSDAHLFAALYALYLILASLGVRDWIRAKRAQDAGLSALAARLAT